ncbi:hypothetical protein KAJ61_02880 [Candidatus Parcubacteria bacterium]|nr:hypothetical protein [Candidatus Parcubacteria bacterium]
MKILVVGSWHKEKAIKYISQAQELGKSLAERGHILVASPNSGFQGLVVKAYKQNNGSEFIGYYPKLKLMDKFGEKVLVEPDTKIYTKQDYPTRNLLQIKGSEAVIGITGGFGTLTELIATFYDYKLPAVFYKGSSQIIDKFIKAEPDFAKKINYGNDIEDLLNYLEDMSIKQIIKKS